MASIKLKYSLDEANAKLNELRPQFHSSAWGEYMMISGLPYSTLYKYMRGKCPSPVAANHLLEYVEAFIKKNAA